MAGNIKGITIQFNADIKPFDKSIRDMEKNISKFDKELRAINQALKFNPTSVELWRQKQEVLTAKVNETREKLSALKEQQAAMDASGVDKNTEEYRKLEREIVTTSSKLKTFEAQLKAVGNVDLHALGEKFKEIGDKMTTAGKAATKYLTTPIVGALAASTKSAMSYGDAIAKMSTLADESQVPVKDLKKNIMDLSNQTGIGASELAEAAYQAMSASVETKDVSDFLKDASGLAKAGFLEASDSVDVLTTIMNAYGYSAKDAGKISSQLVRTQNDGKTTVNELAGAMGRVIPTASALNVPLEQLNASYVLLTKQGMNTADSTTYLNGMFTELADGGSTVSEILQSKTGKTFGQLMKDGATLGDVMQILNDSVDGNSEAFLNLWGNTRAGRAALGLLNGGVEEFNAEAAAMASDTDLVGEALDKLQTPGAKARKALNSVKNAGIEIGDVIAPYVEKAAAALQTLADKFNSLSPETQKVIVVVLALVAAIGPLLVMVGTLISSIGNILIMGPVLLSTLAPLAPTILIIIGVIAALVAIGITLYKNWDTIKAKAAALKESILAIWQNIKTGISNAVNSIKTSFQSKFDALKTTISTIWQNIKSAITKPITDAKDTVQGIIDKIKKILSGKLSFPKIKLPHFYIAGEFSLNPPSVPYLDVDWYDKGGIFDRPSVIGVGEKRPEFVGALDDLRKIIREESDPGEIIINVYASQGMDIDALVRKIEQKLIQAQKRRRLANGNI